MRIPLWIEASKLNIVVFGGGRVGTRRALKFLKAGARVTVASLAFTRELEEEAKRNPRLTLVKIDATKDDIEPLIRDADIVVIAVDNREARDRIWSVAEKHHVLVNDATDAEATDVVVPYEAEVNGIRVAVTTEGKSGVTARHALKKIIELLRNDVEIKTMLEALWWAKRYMKTVIPSGKERFPIYFEIEENPEFQEAVRRGDVEKAKEVAKRIIDAHASKYSSQTQPSSQ